MANVADTKFDCDYNIYKGDGLYGEQTPTHRAVVKKAWPIIRNSLSKYFTSIKQNNSTF